MANKKPKPASNTIATNKRARHDYILSDTFEAGLVLQGWEVKSIRSGKVQLVDSYVHVRAACQRDRATVLGHSG